MKKSIFQTTAVFFSVLLLSTGLPDYAMAQEEFEEWKQNYLKEFQEFQNKYDKQFHNMLQEEWKNLDVELSPDFYEEPKPDVFPKADNPESDPETTVSLEQSPKPEEPARESDKKEAEEETDRQVNRQQETESAVTEEGITPTFEPEVEKAKVETNRLTYFDIPINYKYYAAYKTNVEQPVDRQTISDFWKHLSTKDYPSFLKQMREIKNELLLNDYGYAQLLANVGEQIYGKGSPGATLFAWFMLTQSDFGTRIAYNDNNVYLLVKTNPGVFKTTYFTLNGTKYYAINFTGSNSDVPTQLYTYEGDYPKSNLKELNLLFSHRPLFPKQQTNKTLSFSYGDTTYTFEVPIDRQMINFFKDYPKAQLDLYFNSRMESETHEQLLSSLRPLLKEKSDVEKANILLRFVQRAFDYKTDQEQFNTEKKMFPAETLYYPASDCDDRSILFAYLIEHLTDLDYIVLRYPGHLTPAVHFPTDPPQGRPVNYQGKSYHVTDPTYINANAGMIMSDYKNKKPEVIDV